MIFKILPPSNGQRLDKFLGGHIKFSRSQIQKLIKQQGVLINKKRTRTPHYFLKQGDSVNLNFTQHNNLDSRNQAKQINIASQTIPDYQPTVIYNCPDYAIINKPAGLLTHGAIQPPTARLAVARPVTLVDWLIKKFPKIQKVGDEPRWRPGLVHRLDKEVGGVMVIAKTPEMFDHLKEQFKQRKVKKEYLALVYGQVSQNDGLINFPIGRSIKGIKMAARPFKNTRKDQLQFNVDQEVAAAALQSTDQDDQSRLINQKPAETYFEVIKKFQPYTLLKVSPKTGRTNQIRVHLNASGYPIVGEKIYIPKNLKKKQKFDKLFLFSQKLGFRDLGWKWREYQATLPDNLSRFANKNNISSKFKAQNAKPQFKT